MCAVLGFMITLAWVTNDTRQSRITSAMTDQQKRVNESIVDPERYAQVQEEIKKLRAENTKLQNALSSQGGQTKALNDSLQELKSFATLVPMEGEGIVVRLRDLLANNQGATSPNVPLLDTIIHDTDVLKVINELFAAGAEAVSVNDLRVSAGTFVRCAGPTVYMNGERIASPFEIKAIGKSKELFGAMNMPGGVLAEIRQTDPRMVQVESAKMIKVPAYTGPTSKKIAKTPKETK
jgi:uncharacterized protein YlxW (UPF0749 family)